MSDASPAGQLALVRALRLVRRRLALQGALTLVLWWGTATIVGIPVALRLTVFGTPASDLATFWSACTTLVAAGLLVRSWRRLSLGRVARIVETRLGLQERLSTALETSGDLSLVAAALQRDADRHAEGIEVDRAAPWRWPRAPAAATVAAIGLAAAVAWLPNPVERSDDASRQPQYEELGLDADEVERLADLVTREAELRSDPYLEAIANALRQLGRPSGTNATDVEAASTMESILEHLGRAFGGDRSGVAVAERMLTPEFADQQFERSQPHYDDEGYVPFDPIPEFATVTSVAPDDPTAADRHPSDLDLVTAAARGHSQEGARGAEAMHDLLDDALHVPDGEAIARPTGAGELIGAAAEASAGASVLAGRGSPELGAEGAPRESAVGFAVTMIVAGRERDDGRRIEILAPPAEQILEHEPAMFTLGPWQAGPEAAMEHDVAPPHYRAIVGRYGRPSGALRVASAR